MIKSKKELSPDLVSRKTSNLVPLRNRFPKSRIKELPGWRYFGSQSPSLIKITSTKPFKVSSKREFNSPPLYATDEHQNFIFESKSSKILPRLVTHKTKHLGNKDQTTNTIYESKSKKKEKVSISLLVPQDGDSDNESNHLNPLFSHRSIKSPSQESPRQAMIPSKITASLDPSFQVKENFEVLPVLSSKSRLKSPNQPLLEDLNDSQSFDHKKNETKKPSSSNQLLAKGSKARLSKSRNSRSQREKIVKSQKGFRKSRYFQEESSQIRINSQEIYQNHENNQLNPLNDTKNMKNFIQNQHLSSNFLENPQNFLNSEVFERNSSRSGRSRAGNKKGSQKSHLKNASNSRISEEYLENPDNELYEQLNIGSQVKRNVMKLESLENTDEDLSGSSRSDEEGEINEKFKFRAGRDRSVSSESKKNADKLKNNEEREVRLNQKEENEEKSDFEGSERSAAFSPVLSRRKINENTITPVTNPSTTTAHSPVIKTPDLSSPTRGGKKVSNASLLKSSSKLEANQKSLKKHKTSEKTLKTSKNSKNSRQDSSKRKNEISRTEISKKPSEFSRASLEDAGNSEVPIKLDNSSVSNSSKQLKTSLSPSKARPTLNPSQKKRFPTKKSTKNPGKNPESSSDESLKMSIKVTEVADLVKETLQSPDLLKSGLFQDEPSDSNKSNLSSHSFLKVKKPTKEDSRLSSREGSRREGLFPDLKSQKRRSRKRESKNEDSSKKQKKMKNDGEGSDESSESATSSFSNYSVIKKIELEQRFMKKSESLSRQNLLKSSIGMKYMKNYVSGEVKKYIRKLDPVNNFIYNFSFSILKSIKNLVKVQNLVGIKRISNNPTAKRFRLEQAEKDLLIKNKLKTNKNPQELKKTLTKHYIPPKPIRSQNHLQTYYPREIALKEMHSGKNTPKPSKKKMSTSITTDQNDKSSDFSSSESSLDLPILEDPSKKTLLYELSHQEITLMIAKQILHHKDSEEDPHYEVVDFSELEKEMESFNLDDEIKELALKLNTVPKTFAFGPGVNLGLLKQNQMFFDFRELEEGKFEIDFENLNRFSRKQEFLGIKETENEGENFEHFTLKVLPQDNLTDEQMYRQRLKKATIVGKKLRRRREKLNFSPQFTSNQLIFNRGLKEHLKSKEIKFDADDFDERVYLRLKASSSFRMQSL